MRQLIKQFHGSVGMITCPDIDSKGSGFLVSTKRCLFTKSLQ